MEIGIIDVSPRIAHFGDSVTMEFTVTLDEGEAVPRWLSVSLSSQRSADVVTVLRDMSALVSGGTAALSVTYSPDDARVTTWLDGAEACPVTGLHVIGSDARAELRVEELFRFVSDAPRILSFLPERVSLGAPSDEGEQVRLTLRLGLGRYGDAANMSLLLYYAADGEEGSLDLTAAVESALDGIENDDSLVPLTLSNARTWALRLEFSNGHERAEARAQLPRAFANVHLSGRQSGGVAFGCFSSAAEGAPRFDCAYPAYFSAGVFDENGAPLGGGAYAAQETPCGTWADGRTVYRRVISLGAVSTAQKNITLDSAVGMLVNLYGGGRQSTGVFWPVNFYYSNGSCYTWLTNSTTLSMKTSKAFASAVVVLEYTKE